MNLLRWMAAKWPCRFLSSCQTNASSGVWMWTWEFWEGVSSAGGAISTSSASRHHFLLRVYRSQPSWPRRPSFHYFARLVGTDTMRPQKSMCSPCYQSRSNLHRPATWNQLYYLAHQRPQYAIHCLQPSATWHFHFASRAVRIRPSTEQC